MRRLSGSGVVVTLVLLGGCQGVQSALDPAGDQAGGIAGLFWLFLGVLGAIYLLVLVLLVGALLGLRQPAATERKLTGLLTAWAGGTAVIILGLTAFSYGTDAQITRLGDDAELTIEVTAKQFWWQVKYVDPQPSRSFETANEVYLPVGVPVRFILKSQDVIHSFWIPNLHGKTDLIPGRVNETSITARRAGVYRGQCAEFCGFQHAHMALDAVAVPAPEFEAWRESRLKPAPTPTPEDQLRSEGLQVFLTSPCVMCHTIRGTSASSRVGPDLTHVAGRRTIAAGALPYSRGNLGGWIVNPQSIKPGSQMPDIQLDPGQLQALLAYLDSLT
jgi:cytochrome c oxidase subunit 2